MTGAFRSGWLILTRSRLVWPALAALVVFSVSSVLLLFATAARPGGSRLSDPPTTLEGLSRAEALSQLVGMPVMVTGILVLAAAVLHISGQSSTGFVRAAFVYQPRRALWVIGNALALTLGAVIAAVIGGLFSALTGVVCALVQGVDIGAWGAGLPNAVAALGNLALGMIAFAIAGMTLAILLRSAVTALATGLVYALFESLVNSAAPMGKGLLPASAFANVATSGGSGLYLPSLVATFVVLTVMLVGASNLIASRNVTD